MATTNGNVDMSKFYNTNDPDVSDQARSILIKYSGIPENELAPHIRAVRDQAWKLFKYPCIGMYSFLDFSVGEAPKYPEVLERVRNGATLLDLGCCFGQDVRKMVFDGAPAENVAGLELEQQFLDYGFALFQDREKLKSTLVAGDFLSDTPALQEHSLDFIHAASFFHLFTWDDGITALSKAVRLLKPKSGSMIFGRQTGGVEPGEVKHPGFPKGVAYRHDDASFKKLVAQVGEKMGTKLEAEVKMYKAAKWSVETDVRRLQFCIILQ